MKHILIGAAALLALPAIAEEPSQIETQTREVGVAVGKAFTCLSETDERREKMRLASKAIYNMILHDLGSDIAYAFATSAGYGAGQPRVDAECKALAERWEKVKENFEISELLEEN